MLNRDQLSELARLADAGELKPAVDSEFPLAEARGGVRAQPGVRQAREGRATNHPVMEQSSRL
jgi:NADPH:quinone reductase-like Zn-dependent oxidoreductase